MGLGTLPTLQPDVLVFFRAKVEVSTRGNRDGGKGISKCWTAALKRSEGVANWRPNRNFQRQNMASGDTQ